MYILLQASKQVYVLTKKKRTSRFLPKRNEQAGSYQGRSTQENGTLLADDDVFISHCRHVGPSSCAGAHDHCYLESKHTGDSCSQLQQWTQPLGLQAHTQCQGTSLAGPSVVFVFWFWGVFWSALCGLQDLSSWPGIKPRSWQKSLESWPLGDHRTPCVSFLKWSSRSV